MSAIARRIFLPADADGICAVMVGLSTGIPLFPTPCPGSIPLAARVKPGNKR